jgi:predicted GNAT family N-acyltransferase
MRDCHSSRNDDKVNVLVSKSRTRLLPGGIMPDPLLALVSSENAKTRKHFLDLLRGSAASFPDYSFRVEAKPSLEKVAERLNEHLTPSTNRCAVLFSDQFEFDYVDPTASSGARGLVDDFGDRPLATVAIVERPRPGASLKTPTDIDRSLARNCTPDEFQQILQLVLTKLRYLCRPMRRDLKEQIDVQIIPTQTALADYFRLRHMVYTPMSYLDARVERVKSGMDIDWFDTRAVHVGASVRRNGYSELVGTARLVTTEPLRADHQEWTFDLAAGDADLDDLVRNNAVLAMLPVFQSQDLEDLFNRMYREDFKVGELSRVIVRPDFRGVGLSRRLIQEVIELAEKHQLSDLFLECLPMHEELYARSGFLPLKVRGRVFMVNRTMSVMHRSRVSGRKPLTGVHLPVHTS